MTLEQGKKYRVTAKDGLKMDFIVCTIPKGSEYYENPVGLVVSNQIIINKQIKITS